jgi:hypothetical protein
VAKKVSLYQAVSADMSIGQSMEETYASLCIAFENYSHPSDNFRCWVDETNGILFKVSDDETFLVGDDVAYTLLDGVLEVDC